MEYKLEDIETFLAVVEAGSVSAGALRLNLAKSVISERIARLERALGATLLHRSAQGVTATDRGVGFYQRARAVLEQLDAAAESVTEDEHALSGLLRIAAPMSFGTRWLGPALFPLLRQHPRLSVALDLDDRRVDLHAGGYDLGIRSGRLPDSSLVAKRLAGSRMLVCGSPDYVRAHGTPSTLAELSQHATIGYSLVPADQVWQFEPARKGGAPETVGTRCRIVINNGEAMREAAIAGLGLVVLPSFIAVDALRAGTLVNAAPALRPLAQQIWAIYPHSRHPSRKVRAIIEHLRKAFRDGALWEDPLPDMPR
ncbi:MAG: HTH-type transcriptional regulator DmlR [Steroidobacteraceae bacterium]|nr:HTH-type transcriptional regulator DmlR [Steroidobacteraceae bacterium]